jgi:hypothetical protein
MKKLSTQAPLIREAEEKAMSELQKDWREYFGAKLAKFGVNSPADLDEEKKKEFFNDLKSDWEKGKGATEAGKKDIEEQGVKEGEEVNEKEITAEELVKKIIKGNSRFKWLNDDLPKNYTLDDVKNALDDAGYSKEYTKYIKEGEEVNEAGEFKVGDKVALLSKADKKKFDAGVVVKIQSDGNVVVDKTKNFSLEIVMDPEFLVKENEEVNEAEVKTEAEFKEYAEKVLKKAHKDDYDEAKAKKTIDGILKKSDGDLGAAVGMLTSGLA